MKKWLLRIALTLIGLILLAAVSLFGFYHYKRWAAEKAQIERSVEIRSFYPSKVSVFLYSLDSTFTGIDDPDHFHGYRILGSSEITAWDEKAALILSLSEGIRYGKAFAMCFDPHHGLRLVKDERPVDLVICFSCLQVKPFNFNNGKMFSTASFPIGPFNAVLERHRLPIFRLK